MKIGFFGGTFAPVHNGHVNIVFAALKQLNLDLLVVMPCGLPPHKYCEVSKEDRIALTKLAFEGIDKVTVSLFEAEQEGKSFSYLTMEHLKELYPDSELYFVMGADSLRDFATWRCPEKIAELVSLAVVDRADCSLFKDIADIRKKFGAKIVLLQAEKVDVSSTDVRVNYEFGVDNSLLVPTAVDDYIKQHHLFCRFGEQIDKVKHLMETKRFLHTLNVVKAGQDFCKKNNIDTQKAFLACLLHDCGKNISEHDWQKYGFCNKEGLLKSIVHCGLGVEVAKKDFGVTDEDVLNSIRYHTTGRPNMSPLEKLVFVADKAEKTRKYDVSAYYATALKDLDKAFLMVLFDMYDIAVAKYGIDKVDGLTKETISYYTK